MRVDKDKIVNGLDKEDKILISSILDKYESYLKTNKEKISYFLNQRELDLWKLRTKNHNIDYHIIEKIEGTERYVIGFGDIDVLNNYVTIYHGKTDGVISHKDILGTLFSIGLNYQTIGDIYVENDDFYFTNLTSMNMFVEDNLILINNKKVYLEKINEIKIDKSFNRIEISVNSLRIDSVVSKLANLSRSDSLDKIKNKEVLVNMIDVIKPTINIYENDILSIRRVGKFKVGKIIGKTKKDKIILEIYKYV